MPTKARNQRDSRETITGSDIAYRAKEGGSFQDSKDRTRLSDRSTEFLNREKKKATTARESEKNHLEKASIEESLLTRPYEKTNA